MVSDVHFHTIWNWASCLLSHHVVRVAKIVGICVQLGIWLGCGLSISWSLSDEAIRIEVAVGVNHELWVSFGISIWISISWSLSNQVVRIVVAVGVNHELWISIGISIWLSISWSLSDEAVRIEVVVRVIIIIIIIIMYISNP